MSKSTILNTLRGLRKGKSIRTEPTPTPQLQTTVRQTGPGQISIAEEPEIILPQLGRERLPEGTTPEGISFNDPQDLQRTHPEFYEGVAEEGGTVLKRAGGIDNLLNKIADASASADPDSILRRALKGEKPLDEIVAESAKKQSEVEPVMKRVRTRVLESYLDNLGVNTKRGTAGHKLLQSAKAGDGGQGDVLARRRLRQIQDEQISKNESFTQAERLNAFVRSSIDEYTVQLRDSSTDKRAAQGLQGLSPEDKGKASNISLGVLQRMLLSGKTAQKLDEGQAISGVKRTTVAQAIGKKLSQRIPELRPKPDTEFAAGKYGELTGSKKFHADKEWEIKMGAVMLDRLTRDGDRGLVSPTFNHTVRQDRALQTSIKALKYQEPADLQRASVRFTPEELAEGVMSESAARKLGFKDARAMRDKFEDLNKVYASGGWEPWDLKPTPLFREAMKGFRDVEKTGAMPNFSGKPTVSKNAEDLITIKADLDEDILHLSPQRFNPSTAPVFFKAVNHLQKTKWDIDADVLDELQMLAQRDGNGLTPTPRSDQALYQQYGASGRLSEEDLIRKIGDERTKDIEALDDFNTTLGAAKEYSGQGGFHFDVWADFRGRLGYRSAYINPQGDPVSRSLLTLADEQRVPTNQAWEDDVVNEMLSYWGDTKNMTPNQRLQHWEMNKDYFIDLGANWNAGYDKWSGKVKRKDALPFLKAAKELHRKYRLGAKTSGWMSGQDAVTSQAQMVAVLFRDEKLGAYTGLVPEQAADDLYKLTAKDTYSVIEQDYQSALQKRRQGINDLTDDEIHAEYWMHPEVRKYSRDIFKRPVMTDSYNAGGDTMATALVNDGPGFPSVSEIDNPLHFIDFDRARYLTKKMIGVIADPNTEAGDVFRSVTQIKSVARKGADKLVRKTGQKIQTRSGKMEDELEYFQKAGDTFKSVSGFPFRQHYRSTTSGTAKARANQPNPEGIMEVNPTAGFGYRAPVDAPKKDALSRMRTSFSPNIIHSMDADVLHHVVEYLAKKDIPAGTVHDQFFAPGGYSDELRKAYVYGLKKVFKGDRMREMLSEVLPQADVDEILQGVVKGEFDIDSLDKLISDYWSRGVSPINVG